MSEGNFPEPDSSPEMQQVEDTVSSHPDEPPTEADSSGRFLEVIATDQPTSSCEFSAENSDFSSLASKTSSEVQKNSEVSQASPDPSNPSNVCISGGSQASSDLSNPSHVCTETCIHGGARPKTRALTTVHRSSRENERSRVLEQMNRFAEGMEIDFSHNLECFGSVSQQEGTRQINPNVLAEELAGEMGHGPFTHTSSNTAYPYYLPSILQLNRMFTGLSLEDRNIPETATPHRMDTEQEPHPSQSYGLFQHESRININQVPESTRPMDVDEEPSNFFPSWQAPAVEPEHINPMDQETPNEQVKAVEPREEPQQPRQEYRLVRLAMRVPQLGTNVINPNHPYRHRDENMWRTAMMTAYRSERYHSKEVLDDTMSQLERGGVSQEDFFRFYHSARRIDLFRDEGVEEVRSGPEMVEMTIEDRINRIIIAVGFMTVAMLYMRLYISRHPEIDTSSESSAMDSGNVDRSESEPKMDYARLREHVNIELGSSDSTESPKGIASPGNNSPQEIQSPDFVPIPNRGSPVDVLVPLSLVPQRPDTPFSQRSLLVESDPSGSPSSKKRLSLRRAVLALCHPNQSLDNTSGDASPILPDEEVKQKTFAEILDEWIQAEFSETIRMEEEDREKRVLDPGVEVVEASSNQDQCSKAVDDPDKVVDNIGDGDGEDRSKADPVSQSQDEDSKKEEIEGNVKEVSLTEEKIDRPEEVSLESTSEEKGEIECAEPTEEIDDASGSNVEADDSKTDDGDNIARSGRSRKRKEHSNIEEERFTKKGKEY